MRNKSKLELGVSDGLGLVARGFDGLFSLGLRIRSHRLVTAYNANMGSNSIILILLGIMDV